MVCGRPGPAPQTEKREWFARLITQGVSNSQACRIVGVNRKTGKRWRHGRTITSSNGKRLHYPPVINVRKREISPRGLSCGDYAVTTGAGTQAKLVAAVERKSLPDLVSSLTSGRLRFALGELATVPRAAVVVEERYSQVFALDRVRPAVVADGLAELQVRWPMIPIVFCDTRALAEEWTYRYLAAAHAWAQTEDAAIARICLTAGHGDGDGTADAPLAPDPSTAEVRAWARAHGIDVPDRGRLRPEIWQTWQQAHQPRP